MKKEMKIIFIICGLLCVFDLIATIYSHSNGLMEEWNPILDYYMKKSYLLFAVVKIYLTSSVMWLFYISYSYYKRLYVKYILYGVIVLYSNLCIYHVVVLSV